MKKLLLVICVSLCLTGTAVALDAGVTDETAAVATDEGPTPDWIKVDAGVTAVAPVAEPSDPTDVVSADPMGFGKELYASIKSGDYWHALGMFLILATLGFRLLEKRLPFFKTDDGRICALGITAFTTTLGVAAMARVAPSWQLFGSVAMSAVVAMGGYVGIKKLVWPRIKKLLGK